MKNNFRNFLIFRENKLYIIPQLQSNHILSATSFNLKTKTF